MRRTRIKSFNTERVEDIDYVVHGHTYIPGPIAIGNVIYLDTGLVYGGYISILNIDTMKVETFNSVELK